MCNIHETVHLPLSLAYVVIDLNAQYQYLCNKIFTATDLNMI